MSRPVCKACGGSGQSGAALIPPDQCEICAGTGVGMTGPTPGPWRSLRVGVNRNPNAPIPYTIWSRQENGGGVWIATVDGCHDQDVNGWNAWVIGAAPEMLESLKELTEAMRTVHMIGGRSIGKTALYDAGKKALALIDRLEGRS